MKLDYKKVLLVVIIFILTFFISAKIIDMIFYDYMFVIDMQEEGNYKITNSYQNGIAIDLEKEDEVYKATIPEEITGYTINLQIKLDEENKRIEEVTYNDKKLDDGNIIKLTDYTKYDDA